MRLLSDGVSKEKTDRLLTKDLMARYQPVRGLMGFFKGQHDDSPVAIRITPTILPSRSGDKSESPKTFTQTLTGCSVEASLSPGAGAAKVRVHWGGGGELHVLGLLDIGIQVSVMPTTPATRRRRVRIMPSGFGSVMTSASTLAQARSWLSAFGPLLVSLLPGTDVLAVCTPAGLGPQAPVGIAALQAIFLQHWKTEPTRPSALSAIVSPERCWLPGE